MPYAYAGDYYRGGDNYYAGDFLGIGKFIKGAAKAVVNVGGRVLGAALNANPVIAGARSLIGPGTVATPRGPVPMEPVPGFSGAMQRMVPGGASGYMEGGVGGWPKNKNGTPRRARKDGKPWKRPTMNVMNDHAARRAINRIRGARQILHRIESSLPKARPRYTGSRGVITRSEAARALRA